MRFAGDYDPQLDGPVPGSMTPAMVSGGPPSTFRVPDRQLEAVACMCRKQVYQVRRT